MQQQNSRIQTWADECVRIRNFHSACKFTFVHPHLNSASYVYYILSCMPSISSFTRPYHIIMYVFAPFNAIMQCRGWHMQSSI